MVEELGTDPEEVEVDSWEEMGADPWESGADPEEVEADSWEEVGADSWELGIVPRQSSFDKFVSMHERVVSQFVLCCSFVADF